MADANEARDQLIAAGLHPLDAAMISKLVKDHNIETLGQAALLVDQVWPVDDSVGLVTQARAGWYGDPAIDGRYKRLLDAKPEMPAIDPIYRQHAVLLVNEASTAKWVSEAVRQALARIEAKVQDQMSSILTDGIPAQTVRDLELSGLSAQSFKSMINWYVAHSEDDADAFFVKTYLEYMLERSELVKGGPGSGNHGHAGRPGEVGGSAPDGTTAPTDAEDDATVPTTSSDDFSFPTPDELSGGHWEELEGDNSSSASRWIVTTADDRQWFVKQPSLEFLQQGYDEVSSEVSARLLAESLGIETLPVDYVTIDDLYPDDVHFSDKGYGAVLIYPWLPGAKPLKQFSDNFLSSAISDERYMRGNLFDFLIRNTDRHAGNIMLQSDGSPVWIDHGLTFNADDKSAFLPFCWNYADNNPVTDETMTWMENGIQAAKRRANSDTLPHIEFAESRLKILQDRYLEMKDRNPGRMVWRKMNSRLKY